SGWKSILKRLTIIPIERKEKPFKLVRLPDPILARWKQLGLEVKISSDNCPADLGLLLYYFHEVLEGRGEEFFRQSSKKADKEISKMSKEEREKGWSDYHSEVMKQYQKVEETENREFNPDGSAEQGQASFKKIVSTISKYITEIDNLKKELETEKAKPKLKANDTDPQNKGEDNEELIAERDELARDKKTLEQQVLAQNNQLRNKQQEVSNKEQEIERLKKEKSQSEISLNKKITELKKELESQLESLLESLKPINQQIEELEKKIEDLKRVRDFPETTKNPRTINSWFKEGLIIQQQIDLLHEMAQKGMINIDFDNTLYT
ncbi:2245_t:CDS:2, partial [Ambispora leptoticha]